MASHGRSPLADLKDTASWLQSRCDELMQLEQAGADETAALEQKLVAQAVEFEERRERLRKELCAMRKRNRELEDSLLELQKKVNRERGVMNWFQRNI